MSNIIKPKQGIFVPPTFIKEEIDRVHRQDWEDPDRYERQKQKALRYIIVRAPEIAHFAWEQLVREVTRVFHDDLARDPDVREAAQHACWVAEQQHQQEQDLLNAAPEPATEPSTQDEPRGDVRGVDDSEATIERLEWQRKEEELEP